MSAKCYWPVTLAGAYLFSACQSSPATHYFALTAVAPSAALAAPPPPTPIPIRVERITIPAELDRLELVRHSTSNRLRIAAFDRWAAPLDDMIRRVVAADLAARFAPGMIASSNEPAVGEARRRLYIDIQELTADERGAVKLQAAWLLQTPDAAAVRGAEDLAVEASDASADALTVAMSRALAALSDRIAGRLAPYLRNEKSE
jgi:uncharacterized lipoprotein YmbA